MLKSKKKLIFKYTISEKHIMFKSLLTAISLIPMIAAEKFTAPDNYDFEIKYYNNTVCSGKPTVSSTLKGFCLNTKTVKGGYPKCCYDNLEKIGFSDENQFQMCYSYSSPNSTHSGVEYDCKLTNYQGLTLVEVFGIIGLVSIIIFLILFSYCLVWRCCIRGKGYNRLGV